MKIKFIVFKYAFFALLMTIFRCKCDNSRQQISQSAINIKIDSAVLLIYKLYSSCETAILENKDGKVDTLFRNISYLCLPVKIDTPEVYGDTTLITVLFQPAKGYEIEDLRCDFAYTVGFKGSDNYFDFVMFGDNYYTLSALQLKKSKPNMEAIFIDKIAKVDCLSNQLRELLNKQK